LAANDRDPALELAMSLMKQLCEKNPKIDAVPRDLLDPRTGQLLQPVAMVPLRAAFSHIATKCYNITIIIDGLDEAFGNPEARGKIDILEFLVQLKFKIFATSRENMHQNDGWNRLDIDKERDSKDLEHFVTEAISCRVNRESSNHFPQEFIKDLAAQIARVSGGK
jgi:hypothetical protein